jgi:Ca2+-binding RTX toxin-like protein
VPGGNDRLFGGAGDDAIVGENGHDLVFTGVGDDFATGQFGDDRLFGGRGGQELEATSWSVTSTVTGSTEGSGPTSCSVTTSAPFVGPVDRCFG